MKSRTLLVVAGLVVGAAACTPVVFDPPPPAPAPPIPATAPALFSQPPSPSDPPTTPVCTPAGEQGSVWQFTLDHMTGPVVIDVSDDGGCTFRHWANAAPIDNGAALTPWDGRISSWNSFEPTTDLNPDGTPVRLAPTADLRPGATFRVSEYVENDAYVGAYGRGRVLVTFTLNHDGERIGVDGVSVIGGQ